MDLFKGLKYILIGMWTVIFSVFFAYPLIVIIAAIAISLGFFLSPLLLLLALFKVDVFQMLDDLCDKVWNKCKGIYKRITGSLK